MKLNRKDKTNSKGFTLVEIAVTLLVLVILLGVSLGGMIAWRHNAEFKRNNEYAQTMFVAAQSYLAGAKASGTLPDIKRMMEPGSQKTDLEQVNGMGEDAKRLSYLLWDSDDYNVIKDGNALTDKYAKLFYDMFKDYLYDQSLLDAAICVEFDPQEGTVYAVSYTNHATAFVYAHSGGAGEMSILTRDEKTRKENLYGYYSASLAARAPEEPKNKLEVINLEIINDETLDLCWRVKEAAKPDEFPLAITNFKYQVTLYPFKGSEERVSFFINSGVEDSINGTKTSFYTDLDFSDKGIAQGEDAKKWKFRVKVEDNQIRLVLDAADAHAAAIFKETPDAAPLKYKDTYSIMRLGLSDLKEEESQKNSLYAEVQVFPKNGDVYTESTKKGSKNTEHAFLKLQPEGILPGRGYDYNIENARHLFNLRFTEAALAKEDKVEYKVSQSFGWGSQKGLVANNHYFNKGEFWYPAEEQQIEIALADISWVGKSDQELSEEEAEKKEKDLNDVKGKVLQNLRFPAIDKLNPGHTITAETKPGENAPVISGIFLATDYKKSGSKKENSLGLFRENAGTIENLILQESRVISQWKEEGALKGNDRSGLVSGINRKEGKVDNVTVNGGVIKGYGYVGGVVGYNDQGVITKCFTDKKTSVEGDVLVGGIVGFANWEAEEGASPGAIDGQGGINRATVHGRNYVGGIIGANASLVKTPQEPAEVNLDKTYDSSRLVKDWQNEGLVGAEGYYGGGITGFNTGSLENCNSQVEVTSRNWRKLLEQAKLLGGGTSGETTKTMPTGNYIGGIAGYNNGVITHEDRLEITALAAGNDYVGGVVGYNDQSAQINNYNVKGGYLSGNHFVGGYIGCNTTSKALDNTLAVSPSYIEGDYFVGGAVGANLMYMAEDAAAVPGGENQQAEVGYDPENPMGTIKSRTPGKGYFMGGLMGYTALISPRQTADTLEKATVNMTAILSDPGVEPKDWTKGLDEELSAPGDIDQRNVLKITGASLKLNTDGRENERSRITGAAYVAGIVGYNQSESGLYIAGVENSSDVTAEVPIYNIEDYGRTYLDQEKVYSYTGGIIGIVTSRTTLESCSNGESVKIQGKGTYHGALAEVNQGYIWKCTAGNFGEYDMDYVGGIAGVNGYSFDPNDGKLLSATIEDCEVKGILTGASHVGGITADNFGIIDGTRYLEGSGIKGYGQGVGGTAGVNYFEAEGSNVIGSPGSIIDSDLNHIAISGKGRNVGGVAGENYSVITLQAAQVANPGTITGHSNVGGIIGLEALQDERESPRPLQGYDNYAKVTATEGDAAGIVAAIGYEKPFSMNSCKNYGEVISSRYGHSSGITTTVTKGSQIENSENYGSIVSVSNNAAGIAANNRGTILKSTSGSQSNELQMIQGKLAAGGIAGLHEGTIRGCAVEKTEVTDRPESEASTLGGIAGHSVQAGAQILDCSVKSSQILPNTSNTNAGGIAGINEGSIAGDQNVVVVEDVKIRFVSNKIILNGNLGGVAGSSSGPISRCSFAGILEGGRGESRGYGGIAGISASSIEDCTVSGSVSAKGSSSEPVNVGGIAGINEKDGTIFRGNVIPENGKTTVFAKGGCVGGVAGRNYGGISRFKAELITDSAENNVVTRVSQAKVEIKADYGQIGGIVGQNEQGGTVSHVSTGADWSVYAEKHSATDTLGGIIGCNNSDRAMKEIQNLAMVEKAVSGGRYTGGLIGRWEVATLKDWELTDSINRGTVNGATGVGGLIGMVKFNGGRIENCQNYGHVTSVVKDTASVQGGFIAELDYLNENTRLNFVDCINGGDITNLKAAAPKALGGFLGFNTNTQKIKLTFENCVNYGTIYGKGGKNAGFSAADGFGSVNYAYCRNYGRCYTSTSHTKGNLNARFQAFSRNGVMKGTFGIARYEGMQPLLDKPGGSVQSGNKGNAADYSYYLEEESKAGGFIRNITFDGIEEVGINRLADGIGVNGPNATAHNWTKLPSDLSNKALVINFKQPQKLMDMSIQLYARPATYPFFRTNYSYEVGYITESGATGVLSQQNVTIPMYTNYLDVPETFENVEEKVTAVAISFGEVSSGMYDSGIWEIELNNESGDSYVMKGTSQEDQISAGEPLYMTLQSGGTYTGWNDDGANVKNLPYNPYGSDTPYDAKRDYQKIDPLLQVYYENWYEKEQLVLTGAAAAFDQKQFTATWNKNPKAYATRVEIYLSKSSDQPWEKVYTEDVFVTDNNQMKQSLNIDTPESWFGAGYKAYVTIQHVSIGNAFNSNVWKSEEFHLDKSLPVPRVYMLLTDDISGKEYTYVLENPEDFLHDPSYKIHISYDGKYNSKNNISFYAKDVFYRESNQVNEIQKPDRLTNFTVYASCDTATTKTVTKQAFIASSSDGVDTVLHWQRMADIDSDNSYFAGLTPALMYYNLRLRGNRLDTQDGEAFPFETYYRGELMTYDEELGVDVTFASGTKWIPPGGQADMIIKSNQEKDENLYPVSRVQAYPWRSRNNIVYYGWKMKLVNGTVESIIKDEETYLFTADEVRQHFMAGGEMRRGYTASYIETVSETDSSGQVKSTRKYEVIYSQVLDWQSPAHTQILWIEKNDLPKAVASPVIEEDYELANNNNDYIFRWDQALSQEDRSVYEVSLKGYTSQTDTQGRVIYHETGITAKTLQVDGSFRDYTHLELRVIKLGVEDEKEHVIQLSSQSKESFTLKKRLDTVTGVSHTLVSEDGLVYTIFWDPPEEQGQLDAIEEYQVYARTEDMDDPVSVASTFLSPGTPPDTFVNVDFDTLEDLGIREGDTLYIYVMALAKADSGYQDSPKGGERTLKLPVRLPTPALDAMGLTLGSKEELLDENGVPITVSAETFENTGFAFTVGTHSMQAGVFQCEAYIYEEPLATNQEGETTLPGSDKLLKSFQEEDEVLLLEGEALNKGELVFTGLDSSQYAGKYLILRVRSTSEGSITSRWSQYFSPVYTVNGTKTYLPLPLIAAETPVLTEAAPQAVTMESSDLQEESGKITVYQEQLLWDGQEESSGYDVTLHELSAAGKEQLYTDRIYRVCINDQGVWGVEIEGSDGVYFYPFQWMEDMSTSVTEVYGLELRELYMGTDRLGREQYTDYGSSYEIQTEEGAFPFRLYASIRMSIHHWSDAPDTLSFQVLLPDMFLEDGSRYIRTGYATVEALPREGTHEVKSQRAQWQRVFRTEGNEVQYSTILRTLEDEKPWNDGADIPQGWDIIGHQTEVLVSPDEKNAGNGGAIQ